MERDPEAAWVVPQPARLGIEMSTGRRTVHTPDLLVLDRDGDVTIWNARSSERQDDKFLAHSRATEVNTAYRRALQNRDDSETDRLDTFRRDMRTFVSTYDFLAAIVDYDDVELEKRATFGAMIRTCGWPSAG